MKNTAWEFGKTVTFMPKPIFQDNGSGMHCHQSLWLDGNRCSTTPRATRLVGDGAVLHRRFAQARSVADGVGCTDHQLYRRLVPGYEAPVNLVYSQRNRSAAIRIPVVSQRPGTEATLEFRCPDASANPYLAFSAMLLAGLDGIAKRIDPGAPMGDGPVRHVSWEELKVPTVPGSLEESLAALRKPITTFCS